jgi:hypothetical protein
MSLTASNFTSEPATTNSAKLKQNKGAVVDYTVQGVFTTEPLYSVKEESVRGVLNYKMYDQYSGHMVNNTPSYDGSANDEYVIQESGKVYQSGKTYYLGYCTVAKITYSSSGSGS